MAISIFLSAGISAALNFTLIPKIGMNGAAISALIANLISVIYLFYASQKLYPLPFRFRDAIICFGFSWMLIGINYLFIPSEGVTPIIVQLFMCLLFIPLAFWLGIIKKNHVYRAYIFVNQYIRKILGRDTSVVKGNQKI